MNHDRDIDQFNRSVLAEVGQGRRPARAGSGCATAILAVIGLAIAVGGMHAFSQAIDDQLHPEAAAARKAEAAQAERDAATRTAKEEANRKTAERREQDAAIRSEVVAMTTARAKAALARTLRDPESAIYRNVVITGAGSSFCGEVSARNGFGGYADFRTFIVVGGEVVLYAPTEEGPGVQKFEEAFDRWCRRPPQKEAAQGF